MSKFLFEVGQDYWINNGLIVNIIFIDEKGRAYVRVKDGSFRSLIYDTGGKVAHFLNTPGTVRDKWDLKRLVTAYDDFKIDDPVIVWDNESSKKKRYFAGVNAQGLPLAFAGGATSWSVSESNGSPDTIPWANCVKVEAT